MNTSVGTGKYLMRKWHEDRARAIIDRTQFTTEELDWLEVGATEGMGVFNPDTYEAETQPIDPETDSKTYDIRHRPLWMGGDKGD